VSSPSKPRHRLVPLILPALGLLCAGLCAFAYWQRILLPPRLSRLYASELAPAISKFEAMEFSLEVQLQPDLILSAATGEYLEWSSNFHQSLNCPGCEQFPVTVEADATQVCVLSYSRSQAVARASIRQTTMQVDSVSYEPVAPASSSIYRSTYHLVRQDEVGTWKIDRVTNWTPANKGQANFIDVAQEYLDEVGCP